MKDDAIASSSKHTLSTAESHHDSLCAYCTEWAWSFRASLVDLLQGMGSIDSPIHTQEDCVESDLSALKLFAQLTVLLLEALDMAVLDVQFMKLPGWSCAALTSSLRLILRSTQCEGEVGGLFGLAGQGVTKIASGWMERMLVRYWKTRAYGISKYPHGLGSASGCPTGGSPTSRRLAPSKEAGTRFNWVPKLGIGEEIQMYSSMRQLDLRKRYDIEKFGQDLKLRNFKPHASGACFTPFFDGHVDNPPGPH
eukprot:1161925-Pelagomonas_calceolata.AAC.1